MQDTAGVESRTGLEIAVIGMSLRFPGAKNIREFWENLENGKNSVTFFTDQELKEKGIDHEILQNQYYVKAKGVCEGRECFDSDFFDYLPKEAALMDPQVRIFHEVTWEALEHAGYDPFEYEGYIGLYAGLTPNLEFMASIMSGNTSSSSLFEIRYLNSNFFCTLISYKLNLSGPSVAVQTACSTSLVAIHQASRGLLTGECRMALAGGVTIDFTEKSGYIYEPGMILSPDGVCRPFDHKAQGTINGEGAGIVVLKRLDNAIGDGDTIHAVIKGTAINNDGHRKVGYTAPSVEGQKEVIQAALEMAEVEPGTISYVEAHGTGTTLGDPIEIEALKMVFNNGIDTPIKRKHFCGIGSVKSNFGHLDSAAGVAGFIKTVLSLKHRKIPASLHFEKPNPKIDFDNSPFYVNAILKDWEGDFPLRAGVSSFGIGGTNAHVILEEAPTHPSFSEESSPLLLWSAKTKPALDRMTENLKHYIREHPGIDLADLAYTLQVGRASFKYRNMIVGREIKTENLHSSRVTTDEKRRVLFMFPGQGSQYIQMGLGLYHIEPVFKEAMDRCFGILESLMEKDLKAILYPNEGASHVWATEQINQTENTQPLIFVFEYSLAALLMEWGIQPHAMIGHSIGEYVAACLSGVFTLENALKIVVLRARLMQRVPYGAMLSVALAMHKLYPMLGTAKKSSELSLAAVNGPDICVVSGTHDAIDRFNRELIAQGIKTRSLHTSHAFHSPMMETILEEFESQVREIPMSTPQLPYISNITGQWITREQAVDPGYWTRHIRDTVRFELGLELLSQEEQSIYLEIGPGTALSTFARKYPDTIPAASIINLVRHPIGEKGPDHRYLIEKLGKLWLLGVAIDWKAFYKEGKRTRIPLPTYPFEPTLYPIPKTDFRAELQKENHNNNIELTKKENISDWFYIPLWKETIIKSKPHPNEDGASPHTWLVFLEGEGIGQTLVKKLEAEGDTVCIVTPGSGYRKIRENQYLIKPEKREDYESLFKELTQAGKEPHQVLHLWLLTEEKQTEEIPLEIEKILEMGYYSLISLAKTIGNGIGKKENREILQVTALVNHMEMAPGDKEMQPLKATILGAIKTIPLEYPGVNCRAIDTNIFTHLGQPYEEDSWEILMNEIHSEIQDEVVAIRGKQRWIQEITPCPHPKKWANPTHPRIKQGGVYLITGGLGGIGFTLAENLARKYQARIVLIGRTDFPPREQWNQWKSEQGDEDPISLKITRISEWEKAGAKVMVASADVASEEEMQEVLGHVRKTFGSLNGVIHSAGVADGAMIQFRDRASSENVFHPKIKGTIILDHLLKDESPDFFVICSSLSTEVVPLGQVAYTSANAFLDAWAQYKGNNRTRRGRTLAINWDTWQEVGMAADTAVITGETLQKVHHPLFEEGIKQGTTEIFVSHWKPGKVWPLNEHRIMALPTLPGTAYLELAVAAIKKSIKKEEIVEIKDLYFLQPLSIPDTETREVRTILKKEGEYHTFYVISRGETGGNTGENTWQEHARGKIAGIKGGRSKKHNLKKIKEVCPIEGKYQRGKPSATEKQLLSFGPRWDCLRNVHVGKDQALVEVSLKKKYHKDLEEYQMHPALMDNALVSIFQEGEYYLPFSYHGVKVYGTIPDRVFSHTRLLETPSPQENFKDFRITVMDETGQVKIEIEKYTLMTIPPERAQQQDILGGKTQAGFINPTSELHPYTKEPLIPSDPLKHGIKSEEGWDVFIRILGQPRPRIVISTIDLKNRIRNNRILEQETYKKALIENTLPETVHTRPDLSTQYVQAEKEVEKKVARIFQQYLGIDNIGIHDNFFELGANSLTMIQLNSHLEKELGKSLTVVDIYAHPTVRQLSEFLSGQGAEKGMTEEETREVKNRQEKGKDRLKQRKQRQKGAENGR
jgi:acyl transferase domain-containing protein/acyl carrier protein